MCVCVYVQRPSGNPDFVAIFFIPNDVGLLQNKVSQIRNNTDAPTFFGVIPRIFEKHSKVQHHLNILTSCKNTIWLSI